MPRDERYPTPLLNMNPAGWVGLGAVIVMCLGIWHLFGDFFLIGLAIMVIVALVSALAIRAWRAKHPRDRNLLHLDSEPWNVKGRDA